MTIVCSLPVLIGLLLQRLRRPVISAHGGLLVAVRHVLVYPGQFLVSLTGSAVSVLGAV